MPKPLRAAESTLRAAGLARRRLLGALAAGVRLAAALAALGARGLGLLRGLAALALFPFGRRLLPAQPLRRRAQAAAHALRLRRFRRRGLLGLGVRVELAADELDL